MKIEGPFKTLELTDGRQLTSRAVVVATGVSYRKLDVPGCEELTGAGVYYGPPRSKPTSIGTRTC